MGRGEACSPSAGTCARADRPPRRPLGEVKGRWAGLLRVRHAVVAVKAASRGRLSRRRQADKAGRRATGQDAHDVSAPPQVPRRARSPGRQGRFVGVARHPDIPQYRAYRARQKAAARPRRSSWRPATAIVRESRPGRSVSSVGSRAPELPTGLHPGGATTSSSWRDVLRAVRSRPRRARRAAAPRAVPNERRARARA